jgi:SAM-dependent methyltransferase
VPADRDDAPPGPDERSRRLAAESLAGGDPTGWFERLYAEAESDEAGPAAVVPWDREAPQRLLVEWAARRPRAGTGARALVVGCGYGMDAELVQGLGYATVAFDVSPTAIEATRRRFPDSAVTYEVADLLAPPAEWDGAFDLVVESLTVQSLPPPLHAPAIAAVRRTVAPGGTLLVIAAGRPAEPAEPDDPPPWPLTQDEIDAFAAGGLAPVRLERMGDPGDPSWVWRVELRRPG